MKDWHKNPTDKCQERMYCLYERVSENEPRSCSVDWLCSQKGKRRAEAAESRRRLVSVIKNSGGRQRIPMCCEWGHLVGYEEGCWPLPQLCMPPLCPFLSPPKLMIHNGFLWFNGPDAHTGSFLSFHTSAFCQISQVQSAIHFYTLHLSLGLLSYLNAQSWVMWLMELKTFPWIVEISWSTLKIFFFYIFFG